MRCMVYDDFRSDIKTVCYPHSENLKLDIVAGTLNKRNLIHSIKPLTIEIIIRIFVIR